MLDWALATFAGYVAADARYKGPSCGLSAVDNRPYKRMLSAGLDHDPNHDDIAAWLRRLQTALDERDLALQGSTPDGSARSPAPLRTVFGEGPQQLCPFHGIKERTQGVLQAVATERDRLAKSQPKGTRGRPSSTDKAARRVARTNKAMQQTISAWFQERVLLVQRRRTPSERQRLVHSTRGLPQWRTWREIMEPISALFDRRCRTQTALGKLKQVRQWVNRCTGMGEPFKQVFAPHREKALTFLDDKVLPATSNAVERGHRRSRKRQKRVYRVRSKGC